MFPSRSALLKAASTGGLLLSAGIASAAGLDVSNVTTAIGDAAAPIAAIGGAVVLIVVGTKVWKWIASAIGR